MLEPKLLRPVHGLVSLPLSEVELFGFRLLSYTRPASVLPVFSDPSGSTDLLIYQRGDLRGRIAAFVGDPDLMPRNLLPNPLKRRITVALGDLVLCAYEIAARRIAVGQGDKYESKLRNLIQQKTLRRFPFSALEIARFVGENQIEAEYACECWRILSARSIQLAVAWTSGTALSEFAREAIRSLPKDGGSTNVRRRKTKRLRSMARALPSRPSLHREGLVRIGEMLRTMYQNVVAEDLPASLKKLVSDVNTPMTSHKNEKSGLPPKSKRRPKGRWNTHPTEE